MTDIIGQGVIKVVADASDLKAGMAQATQAVKNFEQAAAASGAAAGAGMAGGMDKATGATERLSQSQNRFLGGLNRQVMQLGKTRAEYARFRAEMMGVTSQAEPMLKRLEDAEKVTVRHGNSVKQQAAAMRLLPAQITDVVTSLVSGQPAYLVAIQQGGQLKDSFGGIGPMFKSLAGLISPVAVLFGAAAAAATALALAYKQGSDEGTRFNTALIMTGGSAGVTADAMGLMATRISNIVGTQGAAADAIAQLAESGKIAGTSFESLGRAAVAMQSATGKAVKETVEEFLSLAEGPTDAVKKLNDKYHFLTLAVYEQIRALEDQGKVQAAAELAQKEYARALETRASQVTSNLGTIEKAWKGIVDWAKRGWDAMLGVGRSGSTGEQIAELEARIAQREKTRDQRNSPGAKEKVQNLINADMAALDLLKQSVKEQDVMTRRVGEQAEHNKTLISQSDALARFQKEYGTNQQKINKEIAEWEGQLRRALTTQEKAKIADKYKGSAPRKVVDDEATRMLEKAAETEGILREQLATEEKLGAEAKKRVAFEEQILMLKMKTNLTDNDKSLLKNEDKIREALAVNEGLERQNKSMQDRIGFEEFLTKEIKKERDRVAEVEQKLKDAALAAKDYVDTLDRGYRAEEAGMGLGDSERRRRGGRNQINEKYGQQRQQLDQNRSDMEQEEYDARLKIIEEHQAIALERWEGHYDRIKELQGDANLGAKEAIANYVDAADNQFAQMQSMVEGVAGGMEDAWVKFAETGKLSFSDLAKSVLADIARMQARAAIAAIFKSFGGASGADAGAGSNGLVEFTGYVAKSDSSRPMSTGTNYVPYDGFQASLHKGEAVVPAAYNPANGGGGAPVNVTINMPPGQSPQMSPMEFERVTRNAVRAAMADAKQRNGAF